MLASNTIVRPVNQIVDHQHLCENGQLHIWYCLAGYSFELQCLCNPCISMHCKTGPKAIDAPQPGVEASASDWTSSPWAWSPSEVANTPPAEAKKLRKSWEDHLGALNFHRICWQMMSSTHDFWGNAEESDWVDDSAFRLLKSLSLGINSKCWTFLARQTCLWGDKSGLGTCNDLQWFACRSQKFREQKTRPHIDRSNQQSSQLGAWDCVQVRDVAAG